MTPTAEAPYYQDGETSTNAAAFQISQLVRNGSDARRLLAPIHDWSELSDKVELAEELEQIFRTWDEPGSTDRAVRAQESPTAVPGPGSAQQLRHRSLPHDPARPDSRREVYSRPVLELRRRPHGGPVAKLGTCNLCGSILPGTLRGLGRGQAPGREVNELPEHR